MEENVSQAHLIVGEGVQAFPVIVDLGGDVLILENDSSHSALTPLYVAPRGWKKKDSFDCDLQLFSLKLTRDTNFKDRKK